METEMGVLNRRQFRELWNSYESGLGDWDSGLWISEQSTDKKSRHFVAIKPIHPNEYETFRIWTIKYCSGQVLCYSVDDLEKIAWFGFSHKADIVLFLLRWS